MIRFVISVISVLLLTAFSVQSASIHTMLVSRKALKEQPALDVTLTRIGDIYAAQQTTQKIIFEAPISPDSKWPAELAAMDQTAAEALIAGFRSKGAYTNEHSAVLPLTVYMSHAGPIMDKIPAEGKYPNLIAAIGALTGSDMAPVTETIKAIRDNETAYLAMAGELSILQTTYQSTRELTDKTALLAKRDELKMKRKELKVLRKALVKTIKAALSAAPAQAGDTELQTAVYQALAFAYVLNETAMDASIMVAIQVVRIIPNLPKEIKELGPRLVKEGMDGAVGGLKDVADLSSVSTEDLSKAVLSQLRFEGGSMKVDMGKFGEVVAGDDKLAALKSLTPEILTQVLDKIQGEALAPFVNLVNNAIQAPERIARSLELVQFNLALVSALNRKSVTGGRSLSEALYEVPMPKIKVAEKLTQAADSSMGTLNKKQREQHEKMMKMSPKNVEMGFGHVSIGFSGLPGSTFETNRFSGAYGLDDKKDIQLETPGRGFLMNIAGVGSEKTDFLRDGTFFNFSMSYSGDQAQGVKGDTSAPPGNAKAAELAYALAFTKDPFFFLPHVIGSGPATIEWYAGGGIGFDVGVAWNAIGLKESGTPATDSINKTRPGYIGTVNDIRFSWNNSLTAAGVVRLFDGMLSLTTTYSYFPKEASLLNISATIADWNVLKDSNPANDTLFEVHKPGDYKYKFDLDHAAQNLFGLGNYFSKTLYEGGTALTVNARFNLPFEIKKISNFFNNSGVQQDSIMGVRRPDWQRCILGTLGLTAGFSRRANTYSIIEKRDQFGVTPYLDNDDREFTYKSYSVHLLLDLSFRPDYIAIGAR